MNSRSFFPVLTVSALSLVSLPLAAAPLYDTFGPLDGATWGGTGIPNDEVAISDQWSNGSTLITVAMSATQRYSNPTLTNDGAGTYYAQAGSNFGGAGESSSEGALWNFNFYIDVDSTTETIDDYEFVLFYDFDPAFDNGPAGLGTLNLNDWITYYEGPGATHHEDSQNLMFSWTSTAIPGTVAPPGGVFDPNALGEYNFGIQVTQDGWGVENVRMDVQVVPVPAAVWLFGSALAGLFGWSRRRG